MTATNAAQLPRALTVPLGEGPSPVLPLALLAATVLHLFILLTVSFELPKPHRQVPVEQTMDIVLLNDPGTTADRPAADAALSQRSRVGDSPRGDAVVSAPVDELPSPAAHPPDAVPQTPEPPAPTPPIQEPPPPQLVAAPKPRPARKVAPPSPPQPPRQETPRTVDASQILASRNQEITRLTASLQTRANAYASRQRRRAVSASTREYRYANYLGAWARKVENIGNINYPQAAKDQHLYGNLILDVAVRADGSVEGVRIVRSSGYPLLDQAAIDIVNLAAPYSPFPPDIAAETDVLDIVRTWQFLRGGKLGWEQ
ncbi:energy transducer TonB [uncultured Thiodictyon sp.]|uniref:energy transducer TonB n=1 Tax=uncultured Thiodictyon sp. TaxID=1846217 RepID=UPI0025F964B7|nr:energy transducer TonB [uncultured Thiodictyon sp.]